MMNKSKKLVVALAVSMSLVGGALTSVFANNANNDLARGLISSQYNRDLTAAKDKLEDAEKDKEKAKKAYDRNQDEIDLERKKIASATTPEEKASVPQIQIKIAGLEATSRDLKTKLDDADKALTKAKDRKNEAQKLYDASVVTGDNQTKSPEKSAKKEVSVDEINKILESDKYKNAVNTENLKADIKAKGFDIASFQGNVIQKLENGQTATLSISGGKVECQSTSPTACSASSAAAGTSNPVGGGSLNNKQMQPVSSSSMGGGSLPSGMGGGSLPTPSKSVSNDLSSKTDAGHVQWAIAAMAAAACAAGAGLFIKRRRSLSDQA